MDNTTKDDEVITSLQLKEEQLSIEKKWNELAQVEIYKESVTIEKTIKVPIIQERLVIEKKTIQPTNSNIENQNIETIKIPLTEESIEIKKHPIMLQEIEISKKQCIKTQQVEVSLKKEKLNISTSGKAIIKEINNGISSN
ncbi:MAG: YsnF/AvaK domain-containing protein [Clostridiales bacterium]|nr:YsnF/AvaK domain-containing protein [Clostridiales bacterium]